jgi:hypothetical protein
MQHLQMRFYRIWEQGRGFSHAMMEYRLQTSSHYQCIFPSQTDLLLVVREDWKFGQKTGPCICMLSVLWSLIFFKHTGRLYASMTNVDSNGRTIGN